MKRPLCMLCLAFVVSISLIMQIWSQPSFSLLENDGAFVNLIGEVITKQTNQENLIIYLSNVTFQIKSKQQKVQGVICYLPIKEKTKSDIYIGSKIKVKGIAKDFRIPGNKGEFHQKRYQELEGYSFYCVEAEIIEKTLQYDRRKEFLYRIKEGLSKSLDRSFSKENSGIMKAMLLGEKQEMEPDTKALYQKNGIAHVLAISGLHISIIGMGLYLLLAKIRIPIPANIIICILLISQYGAMTGLSASCKRAVIMFGIQLLAQLNKRSYDMLTAMACSAVWVLVWNPQYIYHSGFLLSFSAIMGIALFVPVMKQQFPKLKNIISGISINLTTLPIQLFFFYEFSVNSIFLNLLVIPCMTILLGMGICVAILGILLPQTAIVLAKLPELILLLYKLLCKFFENITILPALIGSPSILQIVIYYVMLSIVIFLYKKKNRKYILPIIVAAVLILCFKMPGDTQITFLDVGQGDAACIKSKEGEVFLIDGGSSSKKQIGKYILLPFLKYSGVSKIDYIFLSHMDEDHISGIREIIGSIKIKNLVVPFSVRENEEFKEMKEHVQKEGIKLFYMHAGDKIVEKNIKIECIAPEKQFQSTKENENSLVLAVSVQELDILFTGDIEGKGEEALLKSIKKERFEILKVSHHGSKQASSEELLEKISPQIAIISAGKNNRYGHPNQEVIDRLTEKNCSIYQTKDSGAITIQTNGKKIKIATFKEKTLDF